MKHKKLISILAFTGLLVGSVFLISFCPLKKQGIEGQVFLVKGNQMPSPDLPDQGRGRPYKTRLAIFQAAHINDVEKLPEHSFYNSIHTSLVAEIETDSLGRFRHKLSPGTYSVFIIENGRYYSNLQNGDGVLGGVTVLKKKFTTLHLKMDAGAVY